jgi:putative transposase
MKYAWINDRRDEFPVKAMCKVLEVSRSGFYKSLHAQPSERALRSQRIRDQVKRLHAESHGTYGSYKISKVMNENDELESACRKTVAKAMQEMGLKSRIRKKFKPKTTEVDPSKKPAKNLLDQVFSAEAPNQKWVTDITYLATASGWVYLACVLDLFSRKIVGWSISDSLETPLVSKALLNAIESRRPDTSQLLHHSDRGCQYTSDEYRGILKRLGITVSMSHVGYCYDNAVMERFFWSLKHEWTNHYEYADLEEARLSVFKYIETFYNNQRIHQTLNYKTPDQFETLFNKGIAG